MIAIVIVISLLTVFQTTGVEAVTNVPYAWTTVGKVVTVQCPLPYSSCTGIAWHWLSESSGPVAITPSTKYSFTNYCGLIINNAREADAVYYQCTISGQKGGVYLFVLQSGPGCSTNPPDTSEDVAELDLIQYECEATIYGIGLPQVTWVDKKGETVEGLQDDNPNDYHIRGTLSTFAEAPKVETMECYASFRSTVAVVSVKVCETEEFEILYSVRNVLTRPLLYVGPGEELTCSADANPEATFQWFVKVEGADDWEFLSDGETVVAELQNGTSSVKYKCVASNEVRGVKYTSESLEVTVTKHGKDIRTAIIVTVCVVALLVIGGIIVGIIVWKKRSGELPTVESLCHFECSGELPTLESLCQCASECSGE